MIFGLVYALALAGYSSTNILIGSYVIKYTGASQLDLGLLFTLQPFVVFARPFICAHADRFQSHKKLLKLCLAGCSFSYIPYILIPYLIQIPAVDQALTFPIRFGILAWAHLLGSISYCGVRALCDALAVNYAKRVGSDFTAYRKWGTLSFGGCGFLIGQINQDWILPDYVPGFAVFCSCMLTAMILVHLWPDEYFDMIGNSSMPSNREALKQVVSRLCCCCSGGSDKKQSNNLGASGEGEEPNYLSNKQQFSIFWLLLKRDYRIPLYLILFTFGGLVGYAPQNFVFTYINLTCKSKKTCNGAVLGGMAMFTYCITETIFYMIVEKLHGRLSNIFLMQVTFVSLAFHYYFYAFIMDHVSPYYFLIESLHGLEYSIALAVSMELSYHFANEVEVLIPELKQKGIITEKDNQELVKASLRAALNGCSTTVYDGCGTLIGAFMYGIITDSYSFNMTWLVNATLAVAVIVIVTIVSSIGNCMDIKPQIKRISSESQLKVASV